VGLTRGQQQPLADDLGLGFLLLDLIGMDPVEEILVALGVLHVLNAHRDPLGQDIALDTLVDDRAHRMLGNVKHVARLPMVGLLGHTLLEGATALDVNDVPKLVVLEVGGEMLHTTLLVGPREHAPRAATVAFGAHHFLSLVKVNQAIKAWSI
jgi:hypothetical protein